MKSLQVICDEIEILILQRRKEFEADFHIKKTVQNCYDLCRNEKPNDDVVR